MHDGLHGQLPKDEEFDRDPDVERQEREGRAIKLLVQGEIRNEIRFITRRIVDDFIPGLSEQFKRRVDVSEVDSALRSEAEDILSNISSVNPDRRGRK